MNIDPGYPPGLEPFYCSPGDGQDLLLYEGPLSVYEDSPPFEGVVVLQWLPTPRVAFRVWSKETPAIYGLERLRHLETPSRDPTLPAAATKDLRPSRSAPPPIPSDICENQAGWFSRPIELGELRPVPAVRFNLINFNQLMGSSVTAVAAGRGWKRNRITLAAEEWILRIDSADDDVFQVLKRSGGYAFTHFAELRREDGSDFSWDKDFEICLVHFLMFVRGQRVGVALPVGFSPEDEPKWATWRVNVVDRWRGGFSWADPNTPRSVETLFPLFVDRWRGEFWHIPLGRAVQYYVESNRTDPIDTSIILAQAGLELLAWAILVEDPNGRRLSKNKAKDLGASGRIEETLNWARISATIPDSLSELKTWANGRNAARAFTDIRNPLTHPKAGESTPPSRVMTEAWLLSSYWLELLILKVCGFNGEYGNRLHLGRWAGQVETVPWANSGQ